MLGSQCLLLKMLGHLMLKMYHFDKESLLLWSSVLSCDGFFGWLL